MLAISDAVHNLLMGTVALACAGAAASLIWSAARQMAASKRRDTR